MYRDRTNLFLSYRRTFPHQRLNSSRYLRTEDIESQSFVGESGEGDELIEMRNYSKTLAPKFFDIKSQIDEKLGEIGILLIQLTKLYQKNSLPGFEDNRAEEEEIERISFDIIKKFQECYAIIKTLTRIKDSQYFDNRQLNRDELKILDNLEKSYALNVQDESQRFRLLQNNHLKFLNKDDFKPLPVSKSNDDTLHLLEEELGKEELGDIDSYSKQTLKRQTQKLQGSNQQFLQQRDEEITQLAKGVLEVSTIFREMQSLIIDQGTIIDRIDYNLENTTIELKQAQRELDKATTYQKRTQKCKIIFLLSLLVFAMFLLVMLKPRQHELKQDHPQVNDSIENINDPIFDSATDTISI